MRCVLVSTLALAAVVGCGAPADPTANRVATTGGDYPAGPYGYAQGSTIGNLGFIGKQSPTYVDYGTLTMQSFTFDQLRQNAKLILVEGGARWCTACQQDQPTMRTVEATFAPRGVVALEILVEGQYGVAATEDDINRWVNAYMLSGIVTIDPSYELAKYADVTAFPMYMVVRASTMKIEHIQVASLASSPIEPVLDSLLSQ